jgi:hypothetical protein
MSNMYGYSDYDGPITVNESKIDQNRHCIKEMYSKISPNGNKDVDGDDDVDNECHPLQVGFWMDGDSMAPPCGTSISTIHTILKSLHITSNDILYDLGCGDGRICLEAYYHYHCRAIGIEVESDLVQRAQSLITKLSQEEQFSSFDHLPQVHCMDLRRLFEQWLCLYNQPTNIVTISKDDHEQTTQCSTGTSSFPLPTIIFLYLLPESLVEIECQLSNVLLLTSTDNNAVGGVDNATTSCRIVCNTWGIPKWKPIEQFTIMESSAIGVSTTIYVYTKDSLPSGSIIS